MAVTSLQIGLFMGIGGLSQAIWILLVFPPLQTAEFETATPDRHTYSFYRRPDAVEMRLGA